MKNNYSLLFLCLCLLLQVNTFAQSAAEACDGSRYINDIFDTVTKTTIQYGQSTNISGQSQDLMMDIYTPDGDDPDVKRPVLVLAHGGSFILGSRDFEEAHCRDYARKGFVTASIDYRLWPLQLGFPDSTDIQGVVVMAVADMKAAVRYFRADADGADNYNIDPNLIFVGGTSAGAIAATHTAYMQPEDENVPTTILDIITAQGGIEGTSGSPDYSSAVSGVLNLSGGLYNPNWITADEVPMVSYHGDADGTVPYDFGIAAGIMSIHGSLHMHNRMESLGMNHFLHTVAGGGHTDIYEGGAMDQEWPTFKMESATFFEAIICAATSSKTLTETKAKMKIFPNPARDETLIRVEGAKGNYDVFVFDQLGRRVLTTSGNQNEPVRLAQPVLGRGVLFVRVLFGDGGSVTGKLVFE